MVATRMPANERKALMLEAAVRVFARVGYAAATTDSIAREASVSQAYVVRFFRSKETLFEEAATHVVEQLCQRFVEAPVSPDASEFERRQALGDMYAEVVRDRDTFMMIVRLFMMGSDPRFGQLARESFARVYRLLRDEGGMDSAQARLFLSHGLLINLVLSLRLWEGEKELSDEILEFLGDGRVESIYLLHEGDTLPGEGTPTAHRS